MALDEQGRLISDDGWYVWDGATWVTHAPVPPPPPPPPLPTSVSNLPPPPPRPQAGFDDGLDAEAARYTGLQRMIKPGVLQLRQHLEPGERVLASAMGSGDLAVPGLQFVHVGGHTRRAMVVVATDRRLLLASLTAMNQGIKDLRSIRYDQVDVWKAEKRGITVSGAEASASPFQMKKEQVERLTSVVEPRLAARGSG